MPRGIALISALAALVLAQGSAAGISPQVVVSGSSGSLGARGDVTVELRVPGGLTGALTFFVPPGYAARLDQAPGALVGSVLSGMAEVDGEEVELDGSLTVADPPAAAAEQGCAPSPHAAVWSLALWGPGVATTLPVLVDPVVAGAAESSHASYRLEVCLGDLRLRGLTLRVDGIFANPTRAGAYEWRALGSSGASSPEIELRSRVLLPVTLSLSGRYAVTDRHALVNGTLVAGGEPVAGTSVAVSSSTGTTRRATTDARGRFNMEWAIRSATTFRASVEVAVDDITSAGCADPIAAGGCVSAVRSPFAAESRAVRVAPPARPVLRLGSRGATVKHLQQQLIALRYLPLGTASGAFNERTWHAVVAFQGWQRHARNGVVVARTWTALERARVPAAPGDLVRGLLVDTSRQVMLLVANGRVQRAIHVSTAAPGHWTPHGRFRVYRKEVMSWSVPFQAWMPYANYFYGGFAIHGFASVPSYPASHGCIRVPMVEAPAAYSFAGYGTPVLIR